MLEAYEKLIAGEITPEILSAKSLFDPIGIGAVGGSGTRILARILAQAGVAMASPLNKAGDALEWPPYRKLLDAHIATRYPRKVILNNTHRAFEQLLIERRVALGLNGRVGWKVPGTFHRIKELNTYFPRFQYIHLIRHGMDMAYSPNQAQILNWAKAINVPVDYLADGKVRAHSMLEYWLEANERALADAQRYMPGRMLTVRFENLCRQPIIEIRKVLEFLQLELSAEKVEGLATMVKAPPSTGRFMQHHWQAEFSETQLQRLSKLGYSA